MTLDTARSRWIALYVLCLGDLMIVVDLSIVNVALPSIQSDLGFTDASLAWVINAYLLTFGGFLLLGGRLGDLFGQRRLFLGGIAFFTAASILCGVSTSEWMLVAARAIQGFGGAVVSAVALSLIMGLFMEPAERAKAMGVFGFCMAGGGTVGVLLGGVLTDLLSWHWIFWVNVPVGIAVYVLTMRLLPAMPAQPGRGRLDIAGAVSITAALMLAVYAIVNANGNGWLSAQTLGLLGGGIALLALFFVIESRIAAPLMPLAILKLRNIWASNVVGIFWAAGMFAVFFISALYLQGVLGYSPLQVGLAYLPANVIMMVFSLGDLAPAGDALRDQAAARRRLRAGGRVAVAARARARERRLRHRHPGPDGPARLRCGDGLQPGAARRDERRQAGGVRARVGRRQHGLHDGRRARPRGAGQPRGLAHARPRRARRSRRPDQRVPPRLRRRRDLHAGGCRGRRAAVALAGDRCGCAR